jgi:putative ABC transport system permease protein
MTMPSRHETTYDALMTILLPRAFRRRFRRDMRDLFHDRLADARPRGPAAVCGLWSRAIADLLWHGLAERFTPAGVHAWPHSSSPREDPPMTALWNDLKYAARLLAKRPGFATTGVLTLALAIGANTAIFSVVHAVLIDPLPYDEPGRLVKITGLDERENVATAGNLSVPDFRDFEKNARTFEALGAHNSVGFATIGGGGRPERVRRLLVSSGYFRVLHATPVLGRVFRADEDRPTPPSAVVISHGLWQRRFGGAADAIGRTVEIGGATFTVIGVMRAGFQHPEAPAAEQPEFFALLDPDENVSSRGGRFIRAIGRLAPGATIAQAADELRAIAKPLQAQYPASNTGRSVAVASLTDTLVGGARRALLVLLGAVACVLLIACANLANLLLAESMTRRKELAIRAALGAGRGRLAMPLLAESALLALGGAAAGLALASWSLQGLVAMAGTTLPRADRIAINPPVLAFTLALTILTSLVFGLAPAIAAMRFDVTTSLKDGGRSSGSAAGAARSRSLLVGAEVALSVMLLVAAALFVKSLWRLTHVDPGFAAERVLTANVPVPLSRYPEGTQIDFYARLYARVSRLAGVRSVGATNILPLSGGYSCDGIQIDERPLPDGQNPCAEVRSVSPGYFAAMSIPLVAGRLFDERDTKDSPRVVLINQAMADRFWPGENPIGKRMTYSGRRQGDSREVVGVVANVRHFALDLAPEPEFYTPQAQQPSYHTMTLVIRSEAAFDSRALASAIRAELAALDPEIPLYGVRSMDDFVGTAVSQPRFRTFVLAAFAGVAFVLALVGVYGVVSRTAAQRTQEIGVRVALGARPAQIIALVLQQALVPVVAGLVAGVAGAFMLSRMVTALLFEVTPTDAAAYAIAPCALLLAAAVATSLPAHRASRIDPLVSLRSE